MISTATTATQTSQAQYKPTGNSQVHSAGCIRNGHAICVCDRPASRYISRTLKNPGRAFYRCAHGNCQFWRWEDELLGAGLIPPEDGTQASPRSPPHFQQKREQTANPTALSTPQSLPPAKRSYAHMSTGGSRHAPHPIGGMGIPPKTGIHPSDEAKLAEKKRREAEIQAALDDMKKEDDKENMSEYTDDSDLDAYVAMDVGVKGMGRNTEEERKSLFHPDYDSSDEERLEDPTLPASKKTRVSSVKTEKPESEVTPATALSQSLSQMQHQSQVQVPGPRTPPRRPISTSIQLPTPSETTGRRSTRHTDADDPYGNSESVPPSPTSFTKGAQRAQEKERRCLSITDVRDAGVSTSSLAPLDKGKAHAVPVTPGEPSANFDANQIDGHRTDALQMKVDVEEPAHGTARNTTNVGPFSKFCRGLFRMLTAPSTSIPAPTSVQDSQKQTPYHAAQIDVHVSNSGSINAQEQETERERERKSLDFAKQLASTIQLANSSPRLSTSSQIRSRVHSHGEDQSSARNSKELRRSTSTGLSSSYVSVPPLVNTPAPLEQPKDIQTPAHPTRSPPTSSTLLSLLSKMSDNQTALQAAASNMAAQRMTFQAVVHDFIAEYDKMGRRVRELEGNVEKKERENTELVGLVEEYRKRNAELEAFHHGLEQLFQSSSPTR